MIRFFCASVALACLLLLSGCWFVYIPGSAISAISDSLTGAEGNHCVSEVAKVGDTISVPTSAGGTRTYSVKSLSGTSGRCTNPQYPIRALLIDEPGKSNVKVYERQ